MKTSYVSAEQYQQNLFQEFNELANEEIEALIGTCRKIINKIQEDADYEYSGEDELWFVEQILDYSETHRTMSFKQWKALRAFITKYKKNYTTKKF